MARSLYPAANCRSNTDPLCTAFIPHQALQPWLGQVVLTAKSSWEGGRQKRAVPAVLRCGTHPTHSQTASHSESKPGPKSTGWVQLLHPIAEGAIGKNNKTIKQTQSNLLILNVRQTQNMHKLKTGKV